MPRAVPERLAEYARAWATEGVRAWTTAGWWEMPIAVGGEIAPLIVVGVYNTGEHRMDEYTPTRDPKQPAGGKADPTPLQDMGFMYGRSFEDPDGHIWENVFMDMAAMPQSPEPATA